LEVRRNFPLLTLVSLHWRFSRFVIEEKPNVLIFDFTMLPLFLLTKILFKSKGILLVLSRPVGEGGFRGRLHFFHFRLSLLIGKPFVNIFTAISPFEAAEFSRLGQIPDDRMIVMTSPLGEEFEGFNLPIDENARARKKLLLLKLGLDMLLEREILLYHGILDDNRGVMDLLELFAESHKEENRTTLLLVGDGPSKDSIKQFIKRNSANNIILWGPIPYSRIPALVAACDIGLVLFPDNPWWRYQCPTKLIEFLAMGTPVIATDLPGIRWVAGGSPLVVYLKTLTVDSFREALEKARTKKGCDATLDGQSTGHETSRFTAFSIALNLSHIISSL